MFEDWPDPFNFRRTLDPPAPVLVDLATIFPTGADIGRPFGRNHIAMGIKAGGLVVTGKTHGYLHAWARAADGTWLGLVEFVVMTGNQQGRVRVQQWCPQRAISPQR
ncbi:hypothetical protein B7C42_07459 [Nocardia cerradoensis]|uniref:Uncharacterized protein n=1 Tax=Nocardia cerradoensis TaxID=85688 RepID=A0A231GV64_9NOCA|nr:hypothetical protein [Nocardia cerradoensis]OXR40520.1 hypothetical protein B7C42_07459 [Nocardia cerradoensis]